MGVLGDVVELIKTSVDTDELKDNLTAKRYSSIASRANEGTLQFPILISNAMDIDTAQMIVKALERNYATFVQTVLSMNSVSAETDIAKYLKQFHQNTGLNSRIVDGGDIIRIFEENYEGAEFADGKLMLTETYNNATTGAVTAANKYQNVDLRKDMRTDILNRKFNPKNETIFNFKDMKLNKKYNNAVVTEAIRTNRNGQYVPPTDDEIRVAARRAGIDAVADPDRYHDFRDQYDELAYNQYFDSLQDDIQSVGQRPHNDNDQQKIDVAKIANDAEKLNLDTARTNYQLKSRELPQQMLKDNEVKKANELVATTMHSRIHMLNKAGDPIGVQDFVIGIKGTMHPIKSEEMISNMVGACKNNNRVFNFFRWTTGEISFFKDFWLNINDMKNDVANESKGASRWWIALKNRRALAKVQANAFFRNRILPNATIVLTAEEAELIKINYGYDVMNPYFMKKIMETYFLLGFVVVDNSAQIAHFYFDGSPDFESVSFSGLEKENTRDERKFKEMLKVINRN